MPKERFYHLKEEKQERILLAAEEEIKSVPFDKISINKIIQKADIPRGSFYQYFDDKTDLLAYVMCKRSRELYEFVYDVLIKTDHNIFMVFSAVLRYIVKKYKGDDEGSYRNVFPHMKMMEYEQIFPLSITDILRVCCRDGSFGEELEAVLSSPVYQGAPREEILRTIEILVAVLQHSLAQLQKFENRTDELIADFEQKLNIISRGLTGREWNYA